MHEALENQIDFLLSAALKKCGNLEDAEDLTQDTLLSALVFLSKGGTMREPRGWLMTVLTRKYYDCLRRKMHRPVVCIGEDFDIADSRSELDEIARSEEAEVIRREIACLSAIYRNVVVRYYMKGESVGQIASSLGIPEGTVKSRLSAGRQRMKEGINKMESYQRQSYEPIRLHVTNSGQWGMNGEPGSLVNHDLIAQNLLYLAYEKPVSIEDLSRAVGIPAAYVEPIIQRLVDGQLMKQAGGKVYTDFILYTEEDRIRFIPAERKLVEEHFDLFWQAMQAGLDRLRQAEYYTRNGQDERLSLEMYFVFNCMDYGFFRTFVQIFGEDQILPDRPNGGQWIAFGNILGAPGSEKAAEAARYSYAGERHEYLENYLGSKIIGMHVYDPTGFGGKRYHSDPYYTPSYDVFDTDYLKLLYLIHSKADPNRTGFNTEQLRSIPWLTECRILRAENGEAALNIPVLTQSETDALWQICAETKYAMSDDLKELLGEFFKDKKQPIPPHLKSVPLQKQYLWSEYPLLFVVLRYAIKRGRLFDGGYDEGAQPPYPMIFICE